MSLDIIGSNWGPLETLRTSWQYGTVGFKGYPQLSFDYFIIRFEINAQKYFIQCISFFSRSLLINIVLSWLRQETVIFQIFSNKLCRFFSKSFLLFEMFHVKTGVTRWMLFRKRQVQVNSYCNIQLKFLLFTDISNLKLWKLSFTTFQNRRYQTTATYVTIKIEKWQSLWEESGPG